MSSRAILVLRDVPNGRLGSGREAEERQKFPSSTHRRQGAWMMPRSEISHFRSFRAAADSYVSPNNLRDTFLVPSYKE